MQELFCSFRTFFERTDLLASTLGVPLRDLPEIIGISARAMYGYRSGKYPVTAKALRKLQAAETAAGIRIPENPPATSKGNLNDPVLEPIEQIRTAIFEISRILDNLAYTLKDGTRKPDDPAL